MRTPGAYVLILCALLLSAIGCSGATCKEDAQCGAEETCKDGQCVKKEPQTNVCAKDADCKADEACNAGQCGPPPAPCKADSDCKADEACQASKCQKAECTKDADCAGKTKPYCSTARACEWECKENSHCPAGNECKANVCTQGALLCKSDADCKGQLRPYCSDKGACEWQCKQDNDCKITERCDAANHACKIRSDVDCTEDKDCKGDEFCSTAFLCEKRCDKSGFEGVGIPSSECEKADATKAFCVGFGGPEVQGEDYCAAACKEGEGCPKGTYCANAQQGNANEGLSCAPPGEGGFGMLFCRPKPTLRAGVLQRGEKCDPKSTDRTKSCDGHKGLLCAPDGECVLFCGTFDKNTCPSGEECVPNTRSFDGGGFPDGTGACRAKATKAQKADQPCDGKTKRCVAGLICRDGTCTQPSQEGEACVGGGCVVGLTCLIVLDELSRLCRKPCAKDTDCDGGKCVECAHFRGSGVCSSPSTRKTRKLGDACGSGCNSCTPCEEGATCEGPEFCKEGEKPSGCTGSEPCEDGATCTDGTCVSKNTKLTWRKEGELCGDGTNLCLPNMACVEFGATRVCRRYCDVLAGTTSNPRCATGEQCVGEPDSLGYCAKIGTAKVGEQCDDKQKFCAVGLFCAGTRCVQACSRSQGVFRNPTCGGNAICDGGDGGLAKSCEPRDGFQQGSKELGEPCSFSDAQKACNGSKQLFCDRYGTSPVCRKACDPTKTGECASGESCVLYRFSPLGTACVTSMPSKEGEVCDDLTTQEPKRFCAFGLTCLEQRCVKPCDVRKGRENNADCQTGQYCTSFPGQVLAHCHTPKKKEGESCAVGDACLASLVCAAGICRKPCEVLKGVTSNPACASGRECAPVMFWPRVPPIAPAGGGVCVPKGSIPEGGACINQGDRCAAGLSCVSDGGVLCKKEPLPGEYATCKLSEGESGGVFFNPCQQGLFCVRLSLGVSLHNAGWCAKSCDPQKGEQNNPACSSTQRCYATGLKPFAGLCGPSSP